MSNKHSENLFSFYWRCFCDLLIALVLRPFPFNMCTHPLSHTNACTHTHTHTHTHPSTHTHTQARTHAHVHAHTLFLTQACMFEAQTLEHLQQTLFWPFIHLRPPECRQYFPLFHSSLFSRGNVFSLEIETEAEEDLLAFENEPDVINDRSVAGPGVREIKNNNSNNNNNNNNNNNKINNKVLV